MDQVFEGTPAAEIRLEGRRAVRTEVSNDWATRLQWRVSRDGQVLARPQARLEPAYEHPDQTPGTYEIVLEMWKYEGYKSGCQGQYIEVSNKVSYTI
jgi:hypothetical protein